MKRHALLTFILLMLTMQLPALGQKEYKPLRQYIKKGGNSAPVVQQLQKLQKDDDFSDDPELYYLSAEVYRKINDGENTKLYLKQKYDTVTFFSSTYNMFDYLIKCDQKEQGADDSNKKKVKYRSRSHDVLKPIYPNLYNAGLFFIKKKDYKSADQYFSMYIDAAQTPIFQQDNLWARDARMPRAAFWDLVSCYANKDYKGVFKYPSLASQDSANIDLYLQYRALAYSQLGDTAHYVSELYAGLKRVPYDLFFFTHLSDYYMASHQYSKTLALSDSLLKISPNQVIYKKSKMVSLYNLERYDDCISISKEIEAQDTTDANPYYYIGSSYYSRAIEVESQTPPDINSKTYKKYKADARKLYQSALPYFERYRSMCPKESARWAGPLYKIYLTLNMAKKFAEMEQVIATPAKK